MKILVVDDSALMRTVIRRAIDEHDAQQEFEVLDASDGEQALRLVEVHDDIELVLIDWNMPVLDGVEFVKRVRAQGNDVPIIMVSAVSDEDKVFEAAAAGVNAYVEKPVRGAELWQKIREYVG
jgi:two-component system chemotaxis response regulator CheY